MKKKLFEKKMKNWAMNMHFNPIPILYYTFSWGGEGAWDAPPKLYIDSVAPPPPPS